MSLVLLGSDHAGFELKETIADWLVSNGHEARNFGAFSTESCDYPAIAKALCMEMPKSPALGILVCGTGIGMSMAANRFPGIRAALCATELHASLARRHNDANVLCLGSRVTGEALALAIVEAFLKAPFEGGRHKRRIDMLEAQA